MIKTKNYIREGGNARPMYYVDIQCVPEKTKPRIIDVLS